MIHSRYNDKLQMLDEVTEEFFDDQLEVMPPEKTYRKNGSMVAFLVGEGHHHNDGVEQFSCFFRNNGKYYWLGYCDVKNFDGVIENTLKVF